MGEKQDIQYAVLTDATEDCTGLWEAVWEQMASITDGDEREQRYEEHILPAQQLLREFVSKELITLKQHKQWLEDANNPLIYAASYTPLAPEEVLSVLAEQSHWYLPEDESNEWMCFYRTEKGLQVWYGGKEALARVLE